MKQTNIITQIRIDLPKEVVIKTDTTTDESLESFKAVIIGHFQKYGITPTVQLIYKTRVI